LAEFTLTPDFIDTTEYFRSDIAQDCADFPIDDPVSGNYGFDVNDMGVGRSQNKMVMIAVNAEAGEEMDKFLDLQFLQSSSRYAVNGGARLRTTARWLSSPSLRNPGGVLCPRPTLLS
jgi:hypothetical protein